MNYKKMCGKVQVWAHGLLNENQLVLQRMLGNCNHMIIHGLLENCKHLIL